MNMRASIFKLDVEDSSLNVYFYFLKRNQKSVSPRGMPGAELLLKVIEANVRFLNKKPQLILHMPNSCFHC